MRHYGRLPKEFLVLISFILIASSASAQEATLWGALKDAKTAEPLIGDVSIIHPAPLQIRLFHAKTMPNGLYEMSGLPAGEKIVIARAEGYGFAWQQVLLTPAQNFGPVEFSLERAATFEGRVLDEQGLPVVGATVRLAYQYMPAVIFDWQTGETRTNVLGIFQIRNVSPNRDCYLEASHPSFAFRLGETALRALPGQTLVVPALTLRRGVTFAAQLLDGGGDPVAGAEIRLVATRITPSSPFTASSTGLARDRHRVGSTDANGRVTFDGLTDGEYRLLARQPQFADYDQMLGLDRAVSPTMSLVIRLQARR